MEVVRLLHVPDTAPAGRKDPEPPPGFKRVKFEPKTGGSIFQKLLDFSTQLFKKIQARGKNLSSMTTEITILGEAEEVDIRKAAINGIKVASTNNKMLIQTHGIADTGADTNCTDKKLREVLGRDKLPDADVDLQGCTGTNGDKMKEKLRLVTRDKEITVMESRSIQELGYSGPNSREFLDCVKSELNVNKDNEKHFDFNEKGATPRVLVGLKSGNLLANQLNEEDMLKMGIDKPFLSPNLQVWSTPLNSNLLITGSLGVDPKLVELENNYPRFEVIVGKEETEEQIMGKLQKKIERMEEILGEQFEQNWR